MKTLTWGYNKKITQIKTWLWLVCLRHRKTKQRTIVLIDLDCHGENSNEITNLVFELSDLINQRCFDLVKAIK